MRWSLVLAVCIVHTHLIAGFQALKQSPDLLEIVTKLETPGKLGLSRKLSSEDVITIDLSETSSRNIARDIAAADPSPACVDKISGCTELGEIYGYSLCHVYIPWAQNYCPRYCDLCQDPSDTEASISPPPRSSNVTPATAETVTSGPDATTQEVPGETTQTTSCCVDQIGWEKCITHKEDSCEGIYIPWAQANCQAFCGFCQPCPIEPCEDTIANCDQYGEDACVAESFRMWAVTNCRKTCNRCYNYGYHNKWNTNVTTPAVGTTSEEGDVPTPGPTTCQDKLPNCTHYMEESCCGVYEPWARDNCASYCGFCGVPPQRNCTDNIDFCDREPDDLCTNPSYRLFRMENCAGFCRLCDKPWVPPSCSAYLYPETTPVLSTDGSSSPTVITE